MCRLESDQAMIVDRQEGLKLLTTGRRLQLRDWRPSHHRQRPIVTLRADVPSNRGVPQSRPCHAVILGGPDDRSCDLSERGASSTRERLLCQLSLTFSRCSLPGFDVLQRLHVHFCPPSVNLAQGLMYPRHLSHLGGPSSSAGLAGRSKALCPLVQLDTSGIGASSYRNWANGWTTTAIGKAVVSSS